MRSSHMNASSRPKQVVRLSNLALMLSILMLNPGLAWPGAASSSDPAVVGNQGAATSSPKGRIEVFDCENMSRIVVRYLPEGVELRLPDRTVPLARTAGADQKLYNGDGVTFWTAGNYASIEEPGGTYICRSAPNEIDWEDARLRGIELRAAGEDPQWSLEIDEGRQIEFVAAAGSTRRGIPAYAQELHDALARPTYNARSGEHPLRVEFESRLCWFE